eukprot:15365339-Ditylum_brightwellii.AAC.1
MISVQTTHHVRCQKTPEDATQLLSKKNNIKLTQFVIQIPVLAQETWVRTCVEEALGFISFTVRQE